MKEHLIGILLMSCLLLAGCVDPGVEENPSQDEDDGELLPPETELQPGIEHPPEDDGNETGGDDGNDAPDEEGDSNEDTDQADEEESAEETDSDGDGVSDEEDQCAGEDDTVDDDASGEPDCTENQT